jgi:hypothetical protein
MPTSTSYNTTNNNSSSSATVDSSLEYFATLTAKYDSQGQGQAFVSVPFLELVDTKYLSPEWVNIGNPLKLVYFHDPKKLSTPNFNAIQNFFTYAEDDRHEVWNSLELDSGLLRVFSVSIVTKTALEYALAIVAVNVSVQPPAIHFFATDSDQQSKHLGSMLLHIVLGWSSLELDSTALAIVSNADNFSEEFKSWLLKRGFKQAEPKSNSTTLVSVGAASGSNTDKREWQCDESFMEICANNEMVFVSEKVISNEPYSLCMTRERVANKFGSLMTEWGNLEAEHKVAIKTATHQIAKYLNETFDVNPKFWHDCHPTRTQIEKIKEAFVAADKSNRSIAQKLKSGAMSNSDETIQYPKDPFQEYRNEVMGLSSISLGFYGHVLNELKVTMSL